MSGSSRPVAYIAYFNPAKHSDDSAIAFRCQARHPSQEIVHAGGGADQPEENGSQDLESEAVVALQEPYQLDSQPIDLNTESDLSPDLDPDVYTSRSLDAGDATTSRSKASDATESALDLPDIATESYDEDPEVGPFSLPWPPWTGSLARTFQRLPAQKHIQIFWALWIS